MRPIDGDELFQKALDIIKDNLCNKELGILNMIAIAETIDAEPAKHGKWLDEYNDGDWHCSECKAIVEKDEQNRHNWYRCYHCGAKMEENNIS